MKISIKPSHLIIVILIVLFGHNIYLNYRVIKMDMMLNSEIQKNMDYRNRVDTLVSKTSEFYDSWMDNEIITMEGIVNTIEGLQQLVEVHDENVEIYNSQISDLYNKYDHVVSSINTIVNYLR